MGIVSVQIDLVIEVGALPLNVVQWKGGTI